MPTMRRWFGIALLGFVAVLLSGGLYALMEAAGIRASVLLAVPVLILFAGVIAVVVGLIGGGVAAVRGDRAT
jgi:hypothetical protein